MPTRLLVLPLMVTALLLGAAGPAAAKGPSEAVIEAAGLDEPISMRDDDRQLMPWGASGWGHRSGPGSAVVLVLAAAVLVVVGSARDAVAGWLGLGVVPVEQVQKLPAGCGGGCGQRGPGASAGGTQHLAWEEEGVLIRIETEGTWADALAVAERRE